MPRPPLRPTVIDLLRSPQPVRVLPRASVWIDVDRGRARGVLRGSVDAAR